MVTYFKVKRETEAGFRFEKIEKRARKIKKAQTNLADELGLESWRSGSFCAIGGFSSLVFKDNPDLSIFKRVKLGGLTVLDEYMPKISTRKGKEIQKRLDAIDSIKIDEINSCIGFEADFYEMIGFSFNNKQYFGFSVLDSWNFVQSEDFIEITASEYKKLFKKQKHV